MTTYLYERPFRLRIIASCLHKSWFVAVGGNVIKPEYFDTQEERDLIRFIERFYAEYHRAPDADELAAEFVSSDELMQDLLLDVVDLLETKNDELEYAKTKAIEFARIQATGIALVQSIKMRDEGKLDQILPLFKEVDAIGQDVMDLGMDLVEDRQQWLSDEYEGERIATGIYHVDRVIGGIGRGEYGLVIGPSGAGKSRTMINYGLGAAGLLSKCNVLHVTLEMSKRKVAKRYASRLVGRVLERGDELVFEQDLLDHAARKLRGSIRIKQWPNRRLTFTELDRYIDSLIAQDWYPDVLIVDYSANMRHTNPHMELRHRLADTAEDLRGLAVERHIGVWDAAQANRAAFRKEIVDVDDISECWDMIATADLAFTVCQTKTEKAENLLRLHAAKIREEDSSWLVKCRVDPELHMLESIEHITLGEYLQLKEEKQEKQLQIVK